MSNGSSSIQVPLVKALKSKRGLGKRDFCSSDEEEEEFNRTTEIFTEDTPLPKTVSTTKKVHITESKILGTAPPRKPRVGPEYQAKLPALYSQKGSDAKQP